MRNDLSELKFTTSNISYSFNDKSVEIQIETTRPGLWIGKAGRIVDLLKYDLKEETGYEVSVKFVEVNIWTNLYN